MLFITKSGQSLSVYSFILRSYVLSNEGNRKYKIELFYKVEIVSTKWFYNVIGNNVNNAIYLMKKMGKLSWFLCISEKCFIFWQKSHKILKNSTFNGFLKIQKFNGLSKFKFYSKILANLILFVYFHNCFEFKENKADFITLSRKYTQIES